MPLAAGSGRHEDLLDRTELLDEEMHAGCTERHYYEGRSKILCGVWSGTNACAEVVDELEQDFLVPQIILRADPELREHLGTGGRAARDYLAELLVDCLAEDEGQPCLEDPRTFRSVLALGEEERGV